MGSNVSQIWQNVDIINILRLPNVGEKKTKE